MLTLIYHGKFFFSATHLMAMTPAQARMRMSDGSPTRIGAVELRNPLIAAAAEHLIEADGVRRTLAAGGNVRSWHDSALPVSAGNVRSWGRSRHTRYMLEMT
jgi:hypothetical protein